MKKHRKSYAKILALVFILIICFYILNLFNINLSQFLDESGHNYFPTTNYANLSLKYYYFIPFKVRIHKNMPVPVLVLVPGLNGDGEELASRSAFKDFASKEGFVIIAPTFIEDVQNWDDQTSYQYPKAWSGKALNDIITNISQLKNLHISTLYMLGMSAGAQFVSRYSLLYPNYVTACAINAAGGSDDVPRYQATKFYYAIGTKDEKERQNVANTFYKQARFWGIDISLNKYDCEHVLTATEISDELKFFDKVFHSKQ